jgi:hypothetical protein
MTISGLAGLEQMNRRLVFEIPGGSLRIAIASILQESNTFSPVYTRYEDFAPVFGRAVLERHRGKLTEMGGFLDVLDRTKMEAVPVSPHGPLRRTGCCLPTSTN